METLKAGKPLIDFVTLCYKADRPVLIEGPHGIGKSELLPQVAAKLGINYITRDLSLMEPPDLVGMPKASKGRTLYLPPEFLPRDRNGLLVFEELNRCEHVMRAPCLQLLTTRTLNDYTLPKGWLPVAAVNPANGDYVVSDLDPALLSRFTRVQVVPDRKEWLAWAKQNQIHPTVCEYIANDESVFNSPESSPRSWKYVSDLLLAAEASDTPLGTIRAAVLGTVGDERGVAFMCFYKRKERPLTAQQIFPAYRTKHRTAFRGWRDTGRMDMVDASLLAVQKYMQPQDDYEEVRKNPWQWGEFGSFVSDLPGDLRERLKIDFETRRYEFPTRVQREKRGGQQC